MTTTIVPIGALAQGGEASVPAGGTSGQVLVKSSGTDYAVQWSNPPSGISGAVINGSGHLIITKSDSSTLDAGAVVGAAGAAGVGFSSASVNGSGHLILTKSDSSTVDAGAVVGPAGATGPTGPAGTNGAAGATGATGKGITALTINSQGHLVATLSDSSTLDGGAFPGRYRIAYTGSAWPARPSGLPAGMADYDPNGYSGAPNPTDQTQGDRLGVLSSS